MHADQSPLSDAAGMPAHSPAFRRRRLANWLPLGLAYALYYMGRYNVSVAAGPICEHFGWSNAQWGMVITAGFWTYAVSFLLNGPLTDRFGGKAAILVGAGGTALVNLLLGLLLALGGKGPHVLPLFAVAYAANMYFQSFGAVSIVKVNAAWFHVRERGVFGGIFGILISLGYELAYGGGSLILKHLDLPAVFWLPALSILTIAAACAVLVKDTPEEAGYPGFDTADASSGDEEAVSFGYVVRRVFTNPVVLTIASIEFCTGVIRNGTMQWLPKFLQNVHGIPKGDPLLSAYGTGLFLGGIATGLVAGFVSDRVFGSRRLPVAGLWYLGLLASLTVLGLVHTPFLVVAAGVLAAFFFVGIHGLLSGAASMDFGGKKGAASAAGIIDGFVYFGSGLAGAPLGYAIDRLGWGSWAFLLLPFGGVAFLLTLRVWHAMPKGGPASPGAAPPPSPPAPAPAGEAAPAR